MDWPSVDCGEPFSEIATVYEGESVLLGCAIFLEVTVRMDCLAVCLICRLEVCQLTVAFEIVAFSHNGLLRNAIRHPFACAF